MKGLGTIINVLCVIGGGLIGMVFGNKIRSRIRETLITINGIAIMIMAAGGVMAKMIHIENGELTTSGTIMMILSLSIGAIIGESLNIEDKIVRFGEWLKIKTGSEKDNAFVTSSCTVCIGAMAIVGAMQDGISGDYSTLLVKGLLDAIIICVMTASMGKGCIFSAIPIAILQGSVTVLSMFIGGFMSESALNNLSYVGNVLIFCVGLNLIREEKVRVANLLPSILAAIVFGFLNINL